MIDEVWHDDDQEPIFPPELRPVGVTEPVDQPGEMNWRFRVPDGEVVSFADALCGPQQFVAGQDFGDFVVWRHDDIPSYQLAVVVDDAAMRIAEVVRGDGQALSKGHRPLS